jgi:hypothetical protein
VAVRYRLCVELSHRVERTIQHSSSRERNDDVRVTWSLHAELLLPSRWSNSVDRK